MNTPSEGRKTTFQDGEGISPPGVGNLATSSRDSRSPTLDMQTPHAAMLWKADPQGSEVQGQAGLRS